jgi:hypothetical protein
MSALTDNMLRALDRGAAPVSGLPTDIETGRIRLEPER